MLRLFCSFTLVLGVVLTALNLIAQNNEQGRLENAGLVMEEIEIAANR